MPLKKAPDGVGYIRNVSRRHIRIERQTQGLFGQLRANRKIGFPMTERLKSRKKVERNGVMQTRRDPMFLEICFQIVAAVGLDGIQMVYMTPSRQFLG